MLTPSKTNRVIKYFAYTVMTLAIIISLVLGFTLTETVPDEYLEYTGVTIEGGEEPHQLRWVIAAIVFIAGAFNALILFAISEALSRLQEIEYNTERTYKDNERLKASS